MNNGRPTRPVDPALSEHLTELLDLANEAGAEGAWILRGIQEVMLLYQTDPDQDHPLALELADAGVYVLLRFPATDGGVEGIESR